MKRELIRITFVGDIMCERPLLKAYFMNKEYDFRPIFEATKKLFNESDFVIGNLETVFAGKEVGYTNSLYSFNTPDEFLDALKESGIDLFLTANNHCLDRGIDGLKRTIHELDSRNMAHIGTYLNEKEQKKIFVKDIHGIKIAFLNYTYGTGIKDNHVILEKKDQDCVNLLMPQKVGSPIRYNKRKNKVSFLKRNISKLFSEDTKLRIKKKLGKSVGAPRTDELWDELIDYKLLDVLKNDIKQAKKAFYGDTALIDGADTTACMQLENMDSMYYGCVALASVQIPDSAKELSNICNGCVNLKEVHIPSAAQKMNSSFFGCTALESITGEIPSSCTDSGNLFSGCKFLSGTLTVSYTSRTTLSSSFSDAATAGTGLTIIYGTMQKNRRKRPIRASTGEQKVQMKS